MGSENPIRCGQSAGNCKVDARTRSALGGGLRRRRRLLLGLGASGISRCGDRLAGQLESSVFHVYQHQDASSSVLEELGHVLRCSRPASAEDDQHEQRVDATPSTRSARARGSVVLPVLRSTSTADREGSSTSQRFAVIVRRCVGRTHLAPARIRASRADRLFDETRMRMQPSRQRSTKYLQDPQRPHARPSSAPTMRRRYSPSPMAT